MDAVDHGVVLEADLLERNSQTQLGQTTDQSGVDHLQLHARKGLSQALMRPEPERHMVSWVPRQVELRSLLEHPRVAIGELQTDDDTVAGGDS